MKLKIYPSEEEFLKLSEQGNLIPVYTDLMADFETPVSVYAKLQKEKPAFLLESIVRGEHIGRYSFVCCKPRKIFRAYIDKTIITDSEGNTQERPTPQDPLELVEHEMAQYRPVTLAKMPPFCGGAVGFLGHEYIHCIEPTVPLAEKDPLKMPLLYFAIMNSVVIFDHARQTLRLCTNAHIDARTNAQAAYKQATRRLEQLFEQVQEGYSLKPMPYHSSDENLSIPPSNLGKAGYEDMVSKCRDYIHAGDGVQIVGSQRFEKEYKESPLNLYRALRTINPSPYMFSLDAGDFAVVGASPEVHVRCTGRDVEIRPIAGTRPRGIDEDEDNALEKDMLTDPKERAEHLMLVDLARNDIGRVCEVGSIVVKDYAITERYSHVMHIVSQVVGQLAKDKTSYDLMRATFPAGTLTGAPKVRAMQIIAELEKHQRGVYGGALGYFSFEGNLDSCIAIRTALIKDGKIYIQSGAGLVADSVPESEYIESINKAKGMLKAIALSEALNS